MSRSSTANFDPANSPSMQSSHHPLPPAKAVIRPIGMVVAALLTLGLFVVGSTPEASRLFVGPMHWIAHLGTYGLIALAYAYALPRVAALYVAGFVAIVGVAHEYHEISAHAHQFEFADAVVNSAGALIGSLVARLPRVSRRRSSVRGYKS